MSFVSVIVPTYNRSAFLRVAIRSVTNQTHRDLEIIIIDDGSTDDTETVVRGFNDPRIKYFKHNQNLGEAVSRNHGLKESKGDFIAFLDDDDEWHPEKLEKQLSLFHQEDKDIGFVYCGYYSINSRGRILNQRIPEYRGTINGQLLTRNFVGPTSTALIKRTSIDRVGVFDENIAYGMDQDLWLRISKISLFDFVDTPLVKRIIHPGRLSSNPEILLNGLKSMLEKYPAGLGNNKEFCYRKYLGIGILYCWHGKSGEGRTLLRSAIASSPSRIRPYFYYALSFFGPNAFGLYSKIRGRWIKTKQPDVQTPPAW